MVYLKHLIAAHLTLLCVSVIQAQPPKQDPPQSVELDKQAIAILKVVHNAGAELYNKNDSSACYYMYLGALTTVEPFIKHHPKIQQTIISGRKRADARAVDGIKIQAFELHKLIEQVRTELKAELKTTNEPDKLEPELKSEQSKTPKPKKKPADKPKSQPKSGTGKVTMEGKPASKIDVTMVSLNLDKPRVFTTTTDENGTFTLPKEIVAGQYRIMVSGKNIPQQYNMVNTSPLTMKFDDRSNDFNLELSK